jgi:hypothetical protein
MTTDQYTELIDFLARRFGEIDRRFDAREGRFDALEGRVTRVEVSLEALRGDVRIRALEVHWFEA